VPLLFFAKLWQFFAEFHNLYNMYITDFCT